MSRKDQMVKSVFMVTILSILGKITGFFRETVIAAYYGAGGASDTYFVAYTLPSVLFSIVGASMGVIFVPMYVERLKEHQKAAQKFSSSIISITIIVTSILSILGIIFSKYVVMFIAPGFKDQALNTTIHLTRIMFPMFIFISLSYIITGVLQSHESFLVPSIISVPSNIVIILSVILFSREYGIYALGWGTMLGAVSQILIQLPAVKGKLDYRFCVELDDPSIRSYWYLLVPVILGTAVDKVNIMVDKMLASSLMVGSISAINYSTRLLDFAGSVCTGAIIAVVYPNFATMSANEDYKKLTHTTYSAVIGISQIIIPVTAAAIMLNKDIVRFVFERGAFEEKHTNLTAYAFSYYALGLWAMGIREVLNRVFYSLDDTSTPMKISIFAMVLNIGLNILLVKNMGIGGLGLATAISSTAAVLFLLRLLRKRMEHFKLRAFLKEGLKIVLVVFIMLYGMLVFRNYVPMDNFNIKFLSSAAIGFVIYMSLSWYLGIGIFGSIKGRDKQQGNACIEGMEFNNDAPVSVIIPCYMCSDTIARAVHSVWYQTWRPREVILIEDCSPDDGATRDMLHYLMYVYPNNWIKIVTLNKNGGPGNGRNMGWDFATQEYIAFLDADDAWHPQKIEVQLKLMLKNPHIILSGHSYELVKGGFNDFYTIYTLEYFKSLKVDFIKNKKMLLSNQLPTSSVMLKGRDIDERFDNKKFYSEDYLLWLNIMLSGHKGMRIDMPLYYVYEEHRRDGLSSSLWKMQKGEIETYKIVWRKGFINGFVLVILEMVSYIKYIRRLTIEGMTYIIKRFK